MTNEKKTLYEEAIDLLSRINEDLKNNKQLGTINVKMVGVVNDLNSVRLGEITGKESTNDTDINV